MAVFPPTRISAVVAVRSDDAAVRARSFDVLVRAYWKPVYGHIRMRWTRSPSEAQDLTQGFFARAFEKRYFVQYDPAKALFRTYLKTCLDRFIQDADRDGRREKRGGGALVIQVDFNAAEADLECSSLTKIGSIDLHFDHEWMRSLLASAVASLEAHCMKSGKEKQLAVFRKYAIDGDVACGVGSAAPTPSTRPSYAQLAQELTLSVTDVTNYLSWARREFRRVVLEQLREITATDDEFRSEARTLLGVDA